MLQVILLVIDSGGVGAAPDAAHFGDVGANTIQHAIDAVGGVELPHLSAMGLAELVPALKKTSDPLRGGVVRIAPKANGKDTLAGHWEMMGLVVEEPFRTYPQGFPQGVVQQLETAFGRQILGNKAASGTQIIAELGPRHLRTGCPIVYTSADSVLQIAAHEDVVPLETLYQWCQAARDIMRGPDLVGRIIARPFIGVPGAFVRTFHRHDYAIAPWAPTMVDKLQQSGIETVAIGKIGDIFSRHGFDRVVATSGNGDGLEQTVREAAKPSRDRFIFVNLVEFDSHYGHRRDPAGYVRALGDLDGMLPKIWDHLSGGDQVWITADHGCDPTFPGSDHTREWVPWLTYGPRILPGLDSPRSTFADIGATLGALFHVDAVGPGVPWSHLLLS